MPETLSKFIATLRGLWAACDIQCILASHDVVFEWIWRNVVLGLRLPELAKDVCEFIRIVGGLWGATCGLT